MSNDIRYPLDLARYIAEEIEFSIMPYCKRVVIAGSIRREKPEVGDIEIVCEPVAPKTNFATLIPKLSVIKNGEKYTQLLLPEGIKLDLFKVTPPAQWGVILTLRTGPAEFSRKIVTQRRYNWKIVCAT